MHTGGHDGERNGDVQEVRHEGAEGFTTQLQQSGAKEGRTLIEMRRVTGWRTLHLPGDYFLIQRIRPDAILGANFAVIICPHCGDPLVCSNHEVIRDEPLTLAGDVRCPGEGGVFRVLGGSMEIC